jgi:cell pole-organizing protein PopZ
MQSADREPSMEDILASIKKVIADEKELRSAVRAEPKDASQEDEDERGEEGEGADDVLELNDTLAPPVDLGPPLLAEHVAASTRSSLETLTTVAASAPPPPQGNPLEDMIRDMLRPVLKQWLDDHQPGIVDEHVKREISRITGTKL